MSDQTRETPPAPQDLEALRHNVERVIEWLKPHRPWEQDVQARVLAALDELTAARAEIARLTAKAKRCVECDNPVDDPRYDLCSTCDPADPEPLS